MPDQNGHSECAATPDLDVVPHVFVDRNPVADAMTVGVDEPFVVLATGLVEALDDESPRFVIGHERGHVLSGRAVLATLLLQHTVSRVPAGAR